MSKAIVLLSGGMDSTTALALAIKDCDEVVAIGFKYGSKHMDAESRAAQQVADYYKVPFEQVEIPTSLFAGTGSSLLGERSMPHQTYEQLAESKGPSLTVVPFRNPVMISMAVARAIVHDAGYVYIAVHAEDAHNWAYPDCTPETMGPLGAAIYAGSYTKVRLVVPFQWMSKADIVYSAYRLRAPLGLTWSCYDPVVAPESQGGNYFACGECPTCIERLHAFDANELVDPIQYAKSISWPYWFRLYPMFPR